MLTTKEYSRGLLSENIKSVREALLTASENAVTAEPERTAGSTASLSVVGSTSSSAVGGNKINTGITLNTNFKFLKYTQETDINIPILFYVTILQ